MVSAILLAVQEMVSATGGVFMVLPLGLLLYLTQAPGHRSVDSIFTGKQKHVATTQSMQLPMVRKCGVLFKGWVECGSIIALENSDALCCTAMRALQHALTSGLVSSTLYASNDRLHTQDHPCCQADHKESTA